MKRQKRNQFKFIKSILLEIPLYQRRGISNLLSLNNKYFIHINFAIYENENQKI